MHPARRIVVNASDLDLIRARQSLLYADQLDEKRPRAWAEYGYPEHVTVERLRAAYERGGAGHGAVHKLLDKCWQSWPRIKSPESDDETPVERTIAAMFGDGATGLGLWRKLKDFDRRNMIGRYAALIYRIADGRKVSEPLGRGKLVDVVPVYEGQIKVARWDSDLNSPTFGKPLMWQFQARDPRAVDTQAQPDRWEDVHPSRVQILAEGAVGDDFQEGTPLLRAGLNSLINLEKIEGGAAEGFLKNSQRPVVFEFDANTSPQVISNNEDGTQSTRPLSEVMREKVDAMNRSIDSAIAMAGGEAKTLQTTMIDPEGAWTVAANTFAASVRIPFTILFGQQTGRLASNEDQADFNARAKGRRENDLTPMILQFIRRMQACGAMPAGEFEVEWEDLAAPSDADKVGLADQMAAVNQKQAAAGQGAAFSPEEIRRAGGYHEPMVGLDGLPGEGDPAVDEGGAPSPQPGVAPMPPRLAA